MSNPNTAASRGRERDYGRFGGVIGQGFTLVELLVVIAIIALLISLLLPALSSARRQARVVVAHSDLRQIAMALQRYMMESGDTLPPTRSGCGANVNNQLPVELAEGGYLPPSPSAIPQAHMIDVFDPEKQNTYKYRAPGPLYFNGTLFDFPDVAWRPRAKLWVPDDFPYCRDDEGRYYANRKDEPPCPGHFAVWSMGPDPEASMFPRIEGSEVINDAKFPLPRRFWLRSGSRAGLIVHYLDRDGTQHMSQ